MATTYKILGQTAAVAQDTDVYTVPAGTQAVISTIIVSNRESASTFRIAVRPSGVSIPNVEPKHYIAFDVPIAANDSTTLTLGITLGPGDAIMVRNNNQGGTVAFNVFGSEIS